MGQVRLASPPAGSSAPGSTCARATASARRSPSRSTLGRGLRAARRRQRYQTLEDATAYTYLVNDHWRPGIAYPALALDDPTVAIDWPIPLAEAEHLGEGPANPRLADVDARSPPKKTLVLGGGGQLGRALRGRLPGLRHGHPRPELDVTDAEAVAAWPWHEYAVVLNAAAYTAVDAAETPEGRVAAWAANATGPATLAGLAREHGFTLVHFSSDYVFDGTASSPATPRTSRSRRSASTRSPRPPATSPSALAPRHYLLRTSWVIGEGKNFVRTMQSLAEKGVSPSVVDDQVGRLTFTDELVRATRHLLDTRRRVRHLPRLQRRPRHVVGARSRRRSSSAPAAAPTTSPGTSTAAYAEGVLAQGNPFAPRPLNSAMSLEKLRATGFEPEDALSALDRYLAG